MSNNNEYKSNTIDNFKIVLLLADKLTMVINKR